MPFHELGCLLAGDETSSWKGLPGGFNHASKEEARHETFNSPVPWRYKPPIAWPWHEHVVPQACLYDRQGPRIFPTHRPSYHPTRIAGLLQLLSLDLSHGRESPAPGTTVAHSRRELGGAPCLYFGP